MALFEGLIASGGAKLSGLVSSDIPIKLIRGRVQKTLLNKTKNTVSKKIKDRGEKTFVKNLKTGDISDGAKTEVKKIIADEQEKEIDELAKSSLDKFFNVGRNVRKAGQQRTIPKIKEEGWIPGRKTREIEYVLDETDTPSQMRQREKEAFWNTGIVKTGTIGAVGTGTLGAGYLGSKIIRNNNENNKTTVINNIPEQQMKLPQKQKKQKLISNQNEK